MTCKYCSGVYPKRIIDKDCDTGTLKVGIEKNILRASLTTENRCIAKHSEKIKYCPMCGGELSATQ